MSSLPETRIETYVPLYRKYRPQVFADVVGQEAIVRTLGNAIRLSRVAHAYLFCGPRGTGKTSTARIFAKSLNCEQGPTRTPCLQCASCTGIAQGNALDVVEFDAASNNGVGDARELIENCQYSSMSGRFKVYIVDEVHMLTPQAFNALLKTLEEPPANVIFVFATTEAHKVLPTIVSRCQRFDFNRITTQDITTRLQAIATAENIAIDADALRVIARHARGGLRDAVGLLDQVAVLARGQAERVIHRQDVALFIGTLEEELLLRLSRAIAERRAADLLADLDELTNRGVEPLQLLKDLALHFRNLLIVRAAGPGADADALSLPPEYCNALREQGALFPEPEELPQLLGRLSAMERNVRHSAHPQLWLEVGLLELAYRAEIHLVKTLSERVTQLEASLASLGVGTAGLPGTSSPVAAKPASGGATKPAPTVNGSPGQAVSFFQPPASQPVASVPPLESPVPSVGSFRPADSQPAATVTSAASAASAPSLPAKSSGPGSPSVSTNGVSSLPAPVATSDAGITEADYQRICAAVPSLTLRSLLQQQAFPLGFARDVLTIGVTSEPNLTVLKKPDRLVHVQKAAEQFYGRPIRVEPVLEKNRPPASATGRSPASVPAMPPPAPSLPMQGQSVPVLEPAIAAPTPVMPESPSSQPASRPPAMTAISASRRIDFSTPPPGAPVAPPSNGSSPAPFPDQEKDNHSLKQDHQTGTRLPAGVPSWQDDAPPLSDQDGPPLYWDEGESADQPDPTPPSPDKRPEPGEPSPESAPLSAEDAALREAQQHAIQLLQGKILD
jgi:DNA polymerase-3 subunit gamma/tau